MELIITYGIIFIIVLEVTKLTNKAKYERKVRKQEERVFNFDIDQVYKILDLVNERAKFAVQDKINRNPYTNNLDVTFSVDVFGFYDGYIERAVTEINRRPNWNAKIKYVPSPIKKYNLDPYLSITIKDITSVKVKNELVKMGW